MKKLYAILSNFLVWQSGKYTGMNVSSLIVSMNAHLIGLIEACIVFVCLGGVLVAISSSLVFFCFSS